MTLYGARGLRHEPGAQHGYSNYGFVLLGALIEEVSGVSYYDYVRSHVFQPAGMKSTDSLPETEDVANRAIGYMRRNAGGWLDEIPTSLPVEGHSRGWRLLDGRRSLPVRPGTGVREADLEGRCSPKRPGRKRQHYGYGFGVQGEGPLRSYGHGGGAPGMNGDLRVFPQLEYVVVGLSNLDPPAASGLVDFFALRMPNQ